jgi:hypothetical protein
MKDISFSEGRPKAWFVVVGKATHPLYRLLAGRNDFTSHIKVATGWTETCRRRNRLYMLRGKLAIRSKPHDKYWSVACPSVRRFSWMGDRL